nr:ADP-ribosyltransferase [Bacillus cereus]
MDAGYAKTRPVMTEFKVGSGTHGAYMNSDDLTAYPGQYELLLPRNTVYKIEKIYIAIDNNTQKEQIKVEATIK